MDGCRPADGAAGEMFPSAQRAIGDDSAKRSKSKNGKTTAEKQELRQQAGS
jgi:hypothetical protein